MSKDMNVVVIGGGTGSFMVLSGLKKYCNHITALVCMADDGGSTGLLRDELGVLPPGDVRQCLVALSNYPRMRDLFDYRFEDGVGLSGHSFGNLFITALEKTSGSFAEAVETASKVLNIGQHRVIPITLDKVTLNINDGTRVISHERNIREAEFYGQRPQLWLDPTPEPNSAALEAIADADLIVIAPGGLYESLGASLAVNGVGSALAHSNAKKIYICNLMNQDKHTRNFSVEDFADELERLAGCEFLNEVLFNTNIPNDDLLNKYKLEGENLVSCAGRERHYEMVGADLLSAKIWKNNSKSDIIADQRALIRHDSDKLARHILQDLDTTKKVIKTEKVYIVDMDRTLIRTSMLFDCLCDAANSFQDHLGDELRCNYDQYLVARNADFNDLDFESKNEYAMMRLAGRQATFSPTAALNRILSKRQSSATAQDVYKSMSKQLELDEGYRRYLMPDAEKFLRYVNDLDNAEMVILSYGERAFQDAKFEAVVLPILKANNITPRYIATPERRKVNFFKKCIYDDGFRIDDLGLFETIIAREAIQVGDEREDIIGFEQISNYRAYLVKSPVDQSKHAWPSDNELSQNYCQLFERLNQVIEAEEAKN